MPIFIFWMNLLKVRRCVLFPWCCGAHFPVSSPLRFSFVRISRVEASNGCHTVHDSETWKELGRKEESKEAISECHFSSPLLANSPD